MRNFSNNIRILVNNINNKSEIVIDNNAVNNIQHTCVCYVNDGKICQEVAEKEDETLTVEVGSYNNLYISCEFVHTNSVLRCTERVSPRVVIGLPTMLGNSCRELFCGKNAYELQAKGWVNENVPSKDVNVTSDKTSQDKKFFTSHDGNMTSKEKDGRDTVIHSSSSPSARKGTLNLDQDVDNVINMSSTAAVVSVGKIKIVF